jgi:2-(1,2-epoxy-1,2-dihydrophenyl)acetyl-CoA isomerase
MSAAAVLWEQDGAVGRITLNRPEVLNAWNRALGEDLLAILRGEAADPSVRAVLISGAGRAFSAGADLKSGAEAELHPDDGLPDVARRLRDLYNPIIAEVRALPKPVVAAVQGSAVGIGCSLALACDLIVAARDAEFRVGFARVGLMPDGGATLTLPVRLGKARAMELVLLGEPLAAPAALEWGLINAVHPPGALLDEAQALARRLAAGPTRALGAAKLALNNSIYAGLEAQLELEAGGQHRVSRSPDFMEGVVAFLQKREPEFTGA